MWEKLALLLLQGTPPAHGARRVADQVWLSDYTDRSWFFQGFRTLAIGMSRRTIAASTAALCALIAAVGEFPNASGKPIKLACWAGGKVMNMS